MFALGHTAGMALVLLHDSLGLPLAATLVSQQWQALHVNGGDCGVVRSVVLMLCVVLVAMVLVVVVVGGGILLSSGVL